MPRLTIATDIERVGRAMSFMAVAYTDYISARTLLRSELPSQGAMMASTAIEKYIKAMLAAHGQQCSGHLKAAHWNSLINLSSRWAKEINRDFFDLCAKAYSLRYLDVIPTSFNLVIASREFLAELDHTVFAFHKSMTPARNDGLPTRLAWDVARELHDDRLWGENCSLSGEDKTAFIYRKPQLIFECRTTKQFAHVETTYFSHSQPREQGFLREGCRGIVYEGKFSDLQDAFQPVLGVHSKYGSYLRYGHRYNYIVKLKGVEEASPETHMINHWR
jgi:hypothetical protein